MSNAVTTGLSAMQSQDSDSVNLGSNPSPPASQITEKSAVSAPGQPGQHRQDEPDGRTEPGTSRKAVHSLLDAVESKFPGHVEISERVRVLRNNLRRQAGGDDSTALSRQITNNLTELGDVIAGLSCTTHARGDHG